MKKIKKFSKRNKKSKTAISIILTFVIILTFILRINVQAGIQDSTLVRNNIDGIYAVAPLNDRTHLYNLEIYVINNRISYCIEIGKKISTNIYNSTTNINEQEAITKLNKSQLNYIKTIAYFGYQYPGHTDNKYYMAAQELIWEYLNNIDVTWTNELDINGNKINVDSYKNEIIDLANRYQKILSINNNLESRIGESIILTDQNNILSFYKVSSSGKQQASISNNHLKININNSFIGNDKIVLTRENVYSYPSTLYNFDTSQTMLSAGEIEKKDYEINLKVKGLALETNLIDKDTNSNMPSGQAVLEGAIYELYDDKDKLIETFITEKSGVNIIDNLYPGLYYIKQKQPSKGYKYSEEIIKIKLDKDNAKQVLVEEVIKNNIEINKLYEFKNENKREANIQFNIYDNNNVLFNTITTTENGPDIVTLPYGKYTIQQLNTSYGYKRVEDIEVKVETESNTNIKYTLLDERITSKVHIITKDKNTDESILESGIKYKIKEKNEYLFYLNASGEKIEEFSTDKNGEVIIPFNLPYNEYVLEQINPPKKYLKNSETISFTINDKTEYNYVDNQIVLYLDYYNEPIKGKINITTTEENVIAKNNGYEIETSPREKREIEIYNNNELINTYITDELGILIIEDLNLGTYCIKDKETGEEKCIDLTNEDNETRVVEKDIILTKKANTTNIIITNIDEVGDKIEGTTVELYQNNTLINTSLTNEEGIINIKNVPIGDYCIKEVKVLNKYILNDNQICFEIKDLLNNKEIIIKNKIKTTKIKVPNTINNINYQQILTIILFISIIILITFYRKNSKKIINKSVDN